MTSLTTYAAIAREITGDRATVTAIAEGDEDPHFVQPRPSFVPLLRDADLFVSTGMDLELWVPALLDRAGNPRIREGSPGYVAAHDGIRILEIPTNLSRAGGDIHVDGNPHIHTDPMYAILIARNILAVEPVEHKESFANLPVEGIFIGIANGDCPRFEITQQAICRLFQISL